jgi:V/A-type H+-transporting ATPase subunit E
MDVQLKELIDKVKQDGVSQGKQEAERIKQEAEREARQILRDAEKQTQSMIAEATENAKRLKREAEDSIKIASRDMILKLKNRVKALFNQVILEETTKVLSNDLLKDAIVDLIHNWQDEQKNDSRIKVSKRVYEDLSKYFNEKLSVFIKKGLEIKPDESVNAGFIISMKDGALNYDFTAKTIAEIIAGNLTEDIAKLLNAAD